MSILSRLTNRQPELDYSRIAVLSIGDKHHGAFNGLIAPGTRLKWSTSDGTSYKTYDDDRLSDWSKWLWYDVWLPLIEEARRWAGNNPLLVTDGGELVHGAKWTADDEYYSIHASHQMQIAKRAMAPLFKIPNLALYLLAYGTPSHEHGGDSAAMQFADDLNGQGHNVITDQHIEYYLDADCSLNLSHHGPSVSKIERNRENSARNSFKDTIDESLSWSQRISQMYIRAHVHMPVSTPLWYKKGLREIRTHVMITPPLCGPNRFARKVTKSLEGVECGGYLWEAVDGKIGDVKPFLKYRSAKQVYSYQSGNIFFSHMIKDGGHKKRKKKKK